MGRVSQYNKETDTTYVYESESYYDPEKKQSRSKRKLIGKIDKETGKIVPTGKRGPRKRTKKQTDAEKRGAASVTGNPDGIIRSATDPMVRLEFLEDKVVMQEKELNILRSQLSTLEDENRKLRKLSTDAGWVKRENERMSSILQQIRTLTNGEG